MLNKIHIAILQLLVVLVVLMSCNTKDIRQFSEDLPQKEDTIPFIDLDVIKKRGKLIALTENSSTSYYVYKGRPMGFEYELLKRFSDHIGVQLEIITVENIDDFFEYLNKGIGDVIAANLTITKERSRLANFTNYHMVTRQVLVQRLPEDWQKLPSYKIEKMLIRNPLDLAGKTVVVRKNSSFVKRLKNLSDEIGADIVIKEVEGYTTEELIQKVSLGEIDYTVADENVALINKTYYDNIDVKTPVSFPQKIAWATRKNSPKLTKVINVWLREMKKDPEYYAIYQKYFRLRKAQKSRVYSEYSSLQGNRISEYDPLIKKAAQELQWDWRLLASLIYQESKFDPNAVSWTGAVGLMQVLPETAKQFGVYDTLINPVANIKAGKEYLKYLNELWAEKIADKEERIKFILASFNAGVGHVIDARSLAEKHGKNKNKWSDVAYFLEKKSKPEFYRDPVVKFGYCRGYETVKYVSEILTRYKHYQNNLV
jgi:membrane-bound lytic murein transglycosylase F